MFDQTEWVWKDGQMVRWDLATIHVSAHALHYGSGVFEGIRCYDTEEGPAIFRLGAHLRRFSASAEVYGIRIPYSEDELRQAVVECIRINNYTSCYGDRYAITAVIHWECILASVRSKSRF